MTTELSRATTTDVLFAPPTEHWIPVSPDLVKVETISVFLGWGGLVVASVVPVAIWAPWWALVAVAVFWVALLGWRVWAVRRVARSWAYAQRETDLYTTHGILFKELLVVPYGRMQVV